MKEDKLEQHCDKCKGLGVYLTLEYNPNNPNNKCPDCNGKITIEFSEKLDFIDGKLQTWKQYEESKSNIKERIEYKDLLENQEGVINLDFVPEKSNIVERLGMLSKLRSLGHGQLDSRIHSKKKK